MNRRNLAATGLIGAVLAASAVTSLFGIGGEHATLTPVVVPATNPPPLGTQETAADRQWVSSVRKAAGDRRTWLSYDAAMQANAQSWARIEGAKNDPSTQGDDYRTTSSGACWALADRMGVPRSTTKWYRANIASSVGYANPLARDQYGLRHSPPHYRNLIAKTDRYMGIGYYTNPQGRTYLVQEFCAW